MRELSISLYQARYATSVVSEYLDTGTVKEGAKFYKNIFPSGMIFTKDDAYTSEDQV